MTTELFHEVYGSYFQAVAFILKEASQGTLTKENLTRIVNEKAFSESFLSIPEALMNQTWPLIDNCCQTPLEHSPAMPLTTLQKRWLKSLLLDPRVALFQPDISGLEDVEPLFTPDMIVYFDQYGDGDPYESAAYQEIFRTILSALHEKCFLKIHLENIYHVSHTVICHPSHLEYSMKDNKFRLKTVAPDMTINLARITACEVTASQKNIFPKKAPEKQRKRLVLDLIDQRNALERAMLHFSHLEKETQRLDDMHYQIVIYYDAADETELLIRVFSFGPLIRVTAPDEFVKLMIDRLKAQMDLEHL